MDQPDRTHVQQLPGELADKSMAAIAPHLRHTPEVSIEIADALTAAGRALAETTGRDESLRLVRQMRGSRRSLVVRAVADSVGQVIVRAFEPGDRPPEAWAREVSALRTLASVAYVPVPRLLASGSQPPVTVLEDLGDGESLADTLLGADRTRAEQHLYEWVDALADLHRTTVGVGTELARDVGRLTGEPPGSSIDALHDCVRVMRGVVDIPVGFETEIERLGSMLTVDTHAVLTPTDACPDNNIRTPNGVRLIDFEFAEYRHIAWDAASLRVPFPSCWCSWAIPAEVLDRALARYRRRLAPVLPYIESPAFDCALEAATLAWALVSAQWFLRMALADDPPVSEGGISAPPRRALVHDRMSRAAAQSADEYPAINRLCCSLLDRLRTRWPAAELTLEMAPAFR